MKIVVPIALKRIHLDLGPVLALAAVCSCGGDGADGSGPQQPIDHILAPDTALTLNAGAVADVAISLPTAAVVTYTIMDRSTTTPDTFDAAIFTDAEFTYFRNAQPSQGYAPKRSAAPANATGNVPAGTYHLGIRCTNVLENCQFSYAIHAMF